MINRLSVRQRWNTNEIESFVGDKGYDDQSLQDTL